MTTTPDNPPPHNDEEPGSAEPTDVRIDRGIAFGVVAALAVAAAVGPFGWHLLSNEFGSGGSSASASGIVAAAGAGAGVAGGIAGGGGHGSHGDAAAAPTSSPSPTAASTGASQAARASASCETALGNAGSVSGGRGTTASIGNWAIMATPSVSVLRAQAAALRGVVVRQDAKGVPTAAKDLCENVTSVGKLAAMPDTVGATAWQAALSAYVAGATDALAAAANHPGYYQSAQAQLAQGDKELDALSARITATT